jgi:hypothetical protein
MWTSRRAIKNVCESVLTFIKLFYTTGERRSNVRFGVQLCKYLFDFGFKLLTVNKLWPVVRRNAHQCGVIGIVIEL